MSKAVILQHVSFETPGRIVPVLRDFGIPVEIRRLDKGDEVPVDQDEIRVLIVLGGPMGVSDVGNSKFPFLAQELAVLKQRVEQDRPTLGICLGAQLLAHAAGAKVYPNAKPGATPDAPATPMPEFGWGPVNFPFPGGTEPMVFGMVDGSPMFHWHRDTFDLPKLPPPAGYDPAKPGPPPPTGNALLSSTRACKNQAFRFKTSQFGFQYHFEFTKEEIEAVLANDSASLSGTSVTADQVRSDTTKHYARYERLGTRLLTNFVQFLRAY
jgi:GMP synthase-like glutamine amidotransferase